MTSSPQSPAPSPKPPSVWLATGLGIGLATPAMPGTMGAAVWGLPLAWAIGQLPGIGWQVAAIIVLNLIGIPVATAAGRALGGKKDNQAIVWDEIATVPIVFLLVPLTNWRIALRVSCCTGQWISSNRRRRASSNDCRKAWASWPMIGWPAIYGCALFYALAWIDQTNGWGLLSTGG